MILILLCNSKGGYIKRNVLHEGVFKSVSSCTEEASYGFTVTDTEQNILYACTSSCSKVVPFPYHFYRAERLQQGSLLDGNAVSNQGFLYVVMRADYSNIYDSYVKGKMHYVTTLLSKTNANGRFSAFAIYYSYIPLL